MKRLSLLVLCCSLACGSNENGQDAGLNDDASVADAGAEPDAGAADAGASGLHAAFSEFDPDNVTIMLDGDEVVIESNGLPNHTSPYWSNTTARSATDPHSNVLETPTTTKNHKHPQQTTPHQQTPTPPPTPNPHKQPTPQPTTHHHPYPPH